MKPVDLQEAFPGLSDDKAELACHIWASRDAKVLSRLIEQVPATLAYVQRLYSSPYDHRSWRRTVALHALDRLLNTSGVEAIIADDGEVLASYLNVGDPYIVTVILDHENDHLLLASWDSLLERRPQ